ncbi:MAG TPA: ATP-binding protein [Kofleriaceae bacterium]|jgi:signal transduction histidine kinase
MVREARALSLRYVGSLLVVGALLVVAQLAIQHALDRAQGDAGLLNVAGRQRMLSQRLCMWLAVDRRDQVGPVALEWLATQRVLRDHDNPPAVNALFDEIDVDQRAILHDAAIGDVADAFTHQDRFLDGMNRIVSLYEADASGRVLALRRLELALLALVLAVLVLAAVLVVRPAVRGLGAHSAGRERAAQALADAAEHERKRIAQDLHDGLGAHLVGVALVAHSLPASPARDDLDRLLREAIDHTREIARGLHSPTLELEGLGSALRELARRTEQVAKLTCRVELAGVVEPPRAVAVHLHRIAGEAVLNAVKHARAKSIDITLRGDASHIELEIRDDGIGIAERGAGGLGLELMANRAEALGATFAIEPGNPGTIVRCALDLRGTR